MWNLASAGSPAEIQFSDRLHMVSSNPYKSLVKNIHVTEVLMIMAGDFLYTSVFTPLHTLSVFVRVTISLILTYAYQYWHIGCLIT